MATPRFVARFSHSENSTGGNFTFRLKSGEGSNHALAVRLYNRGNLASPTVTYNGDAVTEISRDGSGTDNSARWAGIYVLPAPDLDGDYSLAVSWGSGSSAIWHAIVEHWCDVDQSTPTGTPTNIKGGSSTRTGSSISVAAAVGDMVIDAFAGEDTMTVGADQTRGPSYPTPGAHGSYEEAASTSVTMDWTSASGTYRIGHVGVALKGAGSASTPTLADRSGAKGNSSITLGSRIGAEPVSAGSTVYLAPCASPESASIPNFEPTYWPYAGTMRVGIRVTANATTSASALTLLEDGGDATDGGFTIPAGATGYFVSTAPYESDGTPLISFKLVNGGGGTLSYDAVWLEFEPDDPDTTVSLLSAFSGGSEQQGGGITRYLPAQGSRNSVTTISQSTTWLPLDASLRYLHLTMSADTRSFDSTIDLLKNEATTALSLTVLGSEVEVSPDAGPEAVLIGDRIQHRVVTGAGTGILDGERFNVHAESEEGYFVMSCARGASGLTLANNADRFINIAGELDQSATESAVQFEVPFDFTAIRLWVDLRGNSQGGTSGDDAVFTLRVNGADTVLSVRVPRGDTVRVYSDFVTAVDLEAGDLINFKARTNVSSGGIIIHSIGIVGVSAGAAALLPTLSASTYKPGTLTSTGWTPRVTAT